MRVASLFCLLTLAAAAWGADAADGAGSADAVGKGEFPGLQLLPPGSVVEDITLPRYEDHRVTALLQAKRLCILSRQEIELQGIRASLFNEDGTATEIRAEAARYNFTTKHAASAGAVEVRDARFSACGSQLHFDTESKRGILLGPVRTSLSTSAFSRKGKKN